MIIRPAARLTVGDLPQDLRHAPIDAVDDRTGRRHCRRNTRQLAIDGGKSAGRCGIVRRHARKLAARKRDALGNGTATGQGTKIFRFECGASCLDLCELLATLPRIATAEDPVAPPMVRLPACAAVPLMRTWVPLVENTSCALMGTLPKLQFVAVAHVLLEAPV
jgi:hypothetical protein